MRALLLVAHGSRRSASNEEVMLLAQRLGERTGARYGAVHAAFLELARPSIPEGIAHCIEAGAEQIVVLPYFLSAGRHVAQDIPTQVSAMQLKYPKLDIQIAPYLGRSEALADILLDLSDTGH